MLGRYVEWVPVCPEVEIGMGTPREPVNLVRFGTALRMIAVQSGRDYTDPMHEWGGTRVRELAALDLCGYVLKKNSPSCGLEGVKVYSDSETSERTGRGLFARVVVEAMPWLPVAEEDRLADTEGLENFLEPVVALRRLRDLSGGGLTAQRLVAFHTAHKMSLLARSRVAYDSLGRLVADVGRRDLEDARDVYRQQFMDAMRVAPTRRRHADVLAHMAGHFRNRLDCAAAEELAAAIDAYRRGGVPRAVPVDLIRAHARDLEVEYLSAQTYLESPAIWGQTGVRPGSDRGQTGVKPGSDRGQTGVRPGSDP